MKPKKHRFGPIVLTLMILLLTCNLSFAQDGTVTLVTLNDLHSRIFPYEVSVGEGDSRHKAEVGGLARFGSLVRREERLNPGKTLVTFQGDVNEGPLFYFFHGWAELCGLNTTGVDVAVLGNHEFDLGEGPLSEALAYARFPYTLANGSTENPSLAALLKPYVIQETQNGMRIGFFGLLTPELASLTSGGSEFSVEQDPAMAAERTVAMLEKEGCDLIVALSHCGIVRDREIASRVNGIDVILGGHSHTVMETAEIVTGPGGWETLIGQAGAYSRYAGVMKATIRGGRLDRGQSSWDLVELDGTMPLYTPVMRAIRPFGKVMDDGLRAPIAEIAEAADARNDNVRGGGAPLGNFLADAVAWGGDTTIGFVNGGGIRGNCVYPAGDISYRTLYDIWPFANTLVRVRLTGAELRETMEVSASALTGPHDTYVPEQRTPTGGFLQISGLRVTLDLSRQPALIDNEGKLLQPGERVIRILVRHGDRWFDLDERKTYEVTAPSWIALSGGDKHYVFRKKTVKKENLEKDDVETLAQYIRHLGRTIGLPEDERIVLSGD